MCSDCPPIPAADLAAETKRCLETIAVLSSTLDRHILSCLAVEDQYREAGISYHTSQLSARQPNAFPQHALTKLARIFEISSVSEYNALFAGLHESIVQFTDIRVRYPRTHGTAEQLYHRIFKELDPRYNEAFEKFDAFLDEFEDCFCAAESLLEVSRAIYETDANGVRCAWHDASGSDPLNNPIPARLGEEWAKYRAWIWSLAEAQRMVQHGRTLDQVAFGALWAEEETFVGADTFLARSMGSSSSDEELD
jgi:hypothetical protein